MKDSNNMPHSTSLRSRIRFDDNVSIANNTTASVMSLPLDATDRHNSEDNSSVDSEHSNGNNSSSIEIACDTPPTTPSRLNCVMSPSTTECRRRRTTSGSNADDVMRKKNRVVYTAGRPPWYDCHGTQSKEPFFIGICGGSASGKTTVARSIIESLDVPWVTLLNMDSFYKVLTHEQHEAAVANNYNFDHPSAFDFEMLVKTLKRLKLGKRVEVPIYNFTTHSREKSFKTMYGASVLILEGILTFHNKEILEMMDLKIFVDADSDTRLARRLSRDITERGRDVDGVLKQVENFVKPSFDNFIAPSMQNADIIIPRGGDNYVAIDLIARHIQSRLQIDAINGSGGSTCRALLASGGACNGKLTNGCYTAPPTLYLLKQTPQLKCLHTMIRNRQTSRDEFIFHSHRIMRLLLEHALTLLPYENRDVVTPANKIYHGKRRSLQKICGVSILRAGEAMETALREVVKNCTISKILIQTNPDTLEPELYYLRLPTDIQQCHVLLLDTTVATGAAAMMGIRILLEHDVLEENITLVSLLMSEVGVNTIAYAFPKVKLVTSAVDKHLSESYHILPGIGNFGNRYFGTEENQPTANNDDQEQCDVNDDKFAQKINAAKCSISDRKRQYADCEANRTDLV